MCGFTGVFSPNDLQDIDLSSFSVDKIAHRGPDQNGEFGDQYCLLKHARLAIQDTTESGKQPMSDASGRYTMVFNGEIYNFQAIKKHLESSGTTFRSASDTEVFVNLFAKEGVSCIEKLNGCFAAVIYDNKERSVTLIRDRFGINPLLYTVQDGAIYFSSEMRGLTELPVTRKLDKESLRLYLELNYIPQPWTILEGVFKMRPGTFITFDSSGLKEDRYYSISEEKFNGSYDEAQKEGRKIMEESVQSRLIADVPIGSFLSGGLDSSIVAMLASRHHKNLSTFSVGYKDDPIYDETSHALEVAKHIGSDHTVFELGDEEMLETLPQFLNQVDEPFADSSALAVYLLSKRTAQHVKVALSGDGADEMFGGYLKHQAHYAVIHGGARSKLARLGAPIWSTMPQSRSTRLGNMIRKLDKFAQGAKLSSRERYWRWASILDRESAGRLLGIETSRRADYTSAIENSLHSILRADMNLVLGGDMLRKVDSMSMAHSLEVRVPFLDHRMVDFAFSLPDDFKIHGKKGKRILHDMFKDDLPSTLYERKKHGFEVPLNRWMNGALKQQIDEDWLNEDRIKDEGLFDKEEVSALKKRLWSNDPGDAPATAWALIIFEHWKRSFDPQV